MTGRDKSRPQKRSHGPDEAAATVRVLYSDQPGQDPPFQPRGRCPDWSSAVDLVRRHLGHAVVARRAPAADPSVVALVYSRSGHSYRLEGPSPGPS